MSVALPPPAPGLDVPRSAAAPAGKVGRGNSGYVSLNGCRQGPEGGRRAHTSAGGDAATEVGADQVIMAVLTAAEALQGMPYGACIA